MGVTQSVWISAHSFEKSNETGLRVLGKTEQWRDTQVVHTFTCRSQERHGEKRTA